MLQAIPIVKPAVVAGDIQRAIESAQIIANVIGQTKDIKSYPDLYAAEEEGRIPDPRQAYSLLQKQEKAAGNVVAVVSREYIETLPPYITRKVFKNSRAAATTIRLDRGEVLTIDTTKQLIKILKPAS